MSLQIAAMSARPIERVAFPSEFAALLAALEPYDTLPCALARDAMGRRAWIVVLGWAAVDLKVGLSNGASSGRGANTRPRSDWCPSSRRC
jgi:hypothetical protein